VEDSYRIITLSDDKEVSCHALLIATGVSYRKLDVPGADRLTGAGVYYGAAMTEARACSDQHVVVIGGANSAGQSAVHFSSYASKVTMLVRGPSLQKSMSHYLIEQIAALENVEVRTGSSAIAAHGEEGRLRCLRVKSTDDGEYDLAADACFVFIGAVPHTDWLEGVVARDDHGFILAGPEVRTAGWPLTRPGSPPTTTTPPATVPMLGRTIV